jgi:hypothetical protein
MWHVPTYAASAVGLVVPAGHQIVQTCGKRLCCNPAHFSTAPHRKANRLSADLARAVYGSELPVRKTAALYGVCPATVYRIRQGTIWAHATGHKPTNNKKD